LTGMTTNGRSDIMPRNEIDLMRHNPDDLDRF
jgi:hypothetical protein